MFYNLIKFFRHAPKLSSERKFKPKEIGIVKKVPISFKAKQSIQMRWKMHKDKSMKRKENHQKIKELKNKKKKELKAKKEHKMQEQRAKDTMNNIIKIINKDSKASKYKKRKSNQRHFIHLSMHKKEPTSSGEPAKTVEKHSSNNSVVPQSATSLPPKPITTRRILKPKKLKREINKPTLQRPKLRPRKIAVPCKRAIPVDITTRIQISIPAKISTPVISNPIMKTESELQESQSIPDDPIAWAYNQYLTGQGSFSGNSLQEFLRAKAKQENKKLEDHEPKISKERNNVPLHTQASDKIVVGQVGCPENSNGKDMKVQSNQSKPLRKVETKHTIAKHLTIGANGTEVYFKVDRTKPVASKTRRTLKKQDHEPKSILKVKDNPYWEYDWARVELQIWESDAQLSQKTWKRIICRKLGFYKISRYRQLRRAQKNLSKAKPIRVHIKRDIHLLTGRFDLLKNLFNWYH